MASSTEIRAPGRKPSFDGGWAAARLETGSFVFNESRPARSASKVR